MRHQHCDYNNLCPAVLLDNDATHIFDFDLKIRSNLDEKASGNLIFTQWHGTPSRKYLTRKFSNLVLNRWRSRTNNQVALVNEKTSVKINLERKMKDAKDCIAKIPYHNYTYICNNNVDNEKWFNVSTSQEVPSVRICDFYLFCDLVF